MKPRDIIFWVHLIAGVSAGLIILIMAVTGTMLAFRGEIIAFVERDVRQVQVPLDQSPLSIKDLLVQVRENYPDFKPTALVFKADPQASVMVNLGRDHSAVFVNPYTGKVIGEESSTSHFLEQVESWHRWLAMEGKFKALGHNIKGVTNILFLIMIITGFYLWWPRNWKWKTLQASLQFNFKLKGNARDWNWHNVIGFWFAPFLIIITLTGVIMSYQWANDLLYRMAGNEPPAVMGEKEQQKNKKTEETKDKGAPTDFDKILLVSKQQVPNWKVITFRLSKPGNPINISIEDQGSGYLHRRSQLTIDSASQEITKWEPYWEQNLGRQLRVWARYLHTGEAGGIIGETIAFFAAAAAIMLVWTGLAMAWRRFFYSK